MSETIRKWSRKQWQAIRWFAADKYERMPETETALAHSLGVNPRTLYRWKNMDGFFEEVTRLARDVFIRETAQYYAALKREAIKGNFQHLNLALQMAGEVEKDSQDARIEIVIKRDKSADQPIPVAPGTNGYPRKTIEV